MNRYYLKFNSPIGKLTAIAHEKALLAIWWAKEKGDTKSVLSGENHPVLEKTRKEIREYFDGNRKSFAIPCEFHGTEFQEKVWRALASIPYGEKRAYVDIARAVNSPKAYRAVGSANGKNPIPIIVPCHRVIAADGSLAGFGGGIKIKEYLLNLEAPQKSYGMSEHHESVSKNHHALQRLYRKGEARP